MALKELNCMSWMQGLLNKLPLEIVCGLPQSKETEMLSQAFLKISGGCFLSRYILVIKGREYLISHQYDDLKETEAEKGKNPKHQVVGSETQLRSDPKLDSLGPKKRVLCDQSPCRHYLVNREEIHTT